MKGMGNLSLMVSLFRARMLGHMCQELDPGGYRWPPTFSNSLKIVFWQFWQFTIFSSF
jgi:hypothetical protein